MDVLAIVVALALSQPPPQPRLQDLDEPAKAEHTHFESRLLGDQILSAMSLPYKYGVTQIPCKAKDAQPWRGWRAAREPAGRIQWVVGPVSKVFWSGIYGTCLIQSPLAKDKLGEIERAALECECNGWLPQD